jgi:hypothetical protein
MVQIIKEPHYKKNINSGTTNGNLNGRVAEILSYAPRVLDGNRPKIETHLAIKYGITRYKWNQKNYQSPWWCNLGYYQC